MNRRTYRKSPLFTKKKSTDLIIEALLLSVDEELSTLTSKEKNPYFFCLNDLKTSLRTTEYNATIDELIERLIIWKKEKLHGFQLNELICLQWEKAQKRSFSFFPCCIDENAPSYSILSTVNIAIDELEYLKPVQPPVFRPRRAISSTLT